MRYYDAIKKSFEASCKIQYFASDDDICITFIFFQGSFLFEEHKEYHGYFAIQRDAWLHIPHFIKLDLTLILLSYKIINY